MFFLSDDVSHDLSYNNCIFYVKTLIDGTCRHCEVEKCYIGQLEKVKSLLYLSIRCAISLISAQECSRWHLRLTG